MRPSAAALGALALGAVLFIHGAVPLVALPTLGQAVWTSGFAQSFANTSVVSIHAMNFGAPQPAAIAFGLAGAWPTALLIASGLHPADAYGVMVALWLGVALFFAYRLARLLDAQPAGALGVAVLWMTMPMVWAHADYSMLSLGIALLPFYVHCALVLMRKPSVAAATGYVIACVIAVFMDGYTFVMFVLGGSVLGAWLFVRLPERRAALLRGVLPVHVVGVALAYLLYVSYVRTAAYPAAPLESFRAWGLDLAFLAVPTQGVHWLADWLGLSVPRSENLYFGDRSVWRTTFALPLLAAASWACWRLRGRAVLRGGLVAVALLALYMALGPSLKIDAQRVPAAGPGTAMSAEQALAPTGSAWLSSNVPGLRDMRGAYRWLALANLAGWMLIVMWLSGAQRGERLRAAVVVGVLIVVNLPHLPRKWQADLDHREMLLRLDAELVGDLRSFVAAGERLAFLPYGNDMLVNYLAARVGAVAYNIGGDKNLAAARRHWPLTLRQVQMGAVEEGLPAQALLLLARGEADAVILSYIDLLWAAHQWPPEQRYDDQLRPVLASIAATGMADVIERRDYAVVRLAQSVRGADAAALEAATLRHLCAPPVCHRDVRFAAAGAPLAAGSFRLRVYGDAGSLLEGRVEVVSGHASVRHANIALGAGGAGGIVGEGYLQLHERVEDLQVRAIQGEGGKLRLHGYEITPRRLPANGS